MFNSLPILPQYSNIKDQSFNYSKNGQKYTSQSSLFGYENRNSYSHLGTQSPQSELQNRSELIAQYSNKIMETLQQNQNKVQDRYFERRLLYQEVSQPKLSINYHRQPFPPVFEETLLDDFEKEMKLRIFRKRVEQLQIEQQNQKIKQQLFNDGYILSSNNKLLAKIDPIDSNTWKQIYELKYKMKLDQERMIGQQRDLFLSVGEKQKQKAAKVKKPQKEEQEYYNPEQEEKEKLNNEEEEIVELKDQFGRRQDIILDLEELQDNLKDDIKEFEDRQAQQQQMDYLRQRARVFHARFAFTILYFNEVRRNILLQKQRQYQSMNSDIANTYNSLMKFFRLNSFEPLQNLCKYPKLLPKNMGKVKTIISDFMAQILVNISEFSIDRQCLKFLGFITHDYQFPPQYFLYRYEVNRLNYTAFAALIGMNEGKAMMVIFCFFFIRVLMLKILRDPLQVQPKLTLMEAEDVMITFKTFASFLFFNMMDYLNENVPIQEHNQIKLQVELQIKEKPNITQFSDVTVTHQQSKQFLRDPSFIMTGLFERDDFQLFYEDQKNLPFVEQFQTNLVAIGRKLIQITDDIYAEERVKEKKEKISSLMGQHGQKQKAN